MENFEDYLQKNRKEKLEKEKYFKETIDKLSKRSQYNTKEFEELLEGTQE